MALWNDATYALRQLRKSTGFTLIVLATLALCIGMNTAIYSVLDAVLFRPAPFPEPDRLAMLVTAVRGKGGKPGEEIDTSQTGALYEAVRDTAGLLDCAAWSGIGGGDFFPGGGSKWRGGPPAPGGRPLARGECPICGARPEPPQRPGLPRRGGLLRRAG